MDSEEIAWIVKILSEDSVVINRWKRLWDELGLKRGNHFSVWDTAMKNGTGQIDELYKAMLALWVQEVNPDADLQALCEKLISIKCLYTAKMIQNAAATSHSGGIQENLQNMDRVSASKTSKKLPAQLTSNQKQTSATAGLFVGVVIIVIAGVIQCTLWITKDNDASYSINTEKSLENFIDKNILELTGKTKVSLSLLNFYVGNEIISSDSKEEIMAERSNQRQADALYAHLKRCSETQLELIKDGLKESLNKKALEIFNKFV